MKLSVLPRNLAGQLALLVAVALFAAQAVNFGLALRSATNFRLAQATRPAATRIADALEREAAGRGHIASDRGRVRHAPRDPIPADLERRPEVAEEMRAQLLEVGITAGRIDTGVRPAPAREAASEGTRRGRRGETVVVAVEMPGRGWLAVVSPWPRSDRRILAVLLIQTLILYVIILLPMLWITRRISRPLRALSQAAERFDPGTAADPLPLAGPNDVRSVTAAFNALGLRVNAMIDEKDQMLGAIGHDLRTPLAALRVRIESVDDDEDRAKMADTIDEMNRTLDDILSLARLGRPSEPLTDVDLSALIDAVVDDFQEIGADVTTEETPRFTMRVRPSLMRRAVRNLIENAVKYAGAAEVRLTPGTDRVAIDISDRGPGIPPDQLARVFDPFTRLENSRNRDTGGVGLGLALARAIVREAGGDITLANRDGGGLTATIALPRV